MSEGIWGPLLLWTFPKFSSVESQHGSFSRIIMEGHSMSAGYRGHSPPAPPFSTCFVSGKGFSTYRRTLTIIPLSCRLLRSEQSFLNVYPRSTDPVSSGLSLSERRVNFPHLPCDLSSIYLNQTSIPNWSRLCLCTSNLSRHLDWKNQSLKDEILGVFTSITL